MSHKFQKLKLEELQRVSVQKFKEQQKLPVVIILDNIRSMHNVGSVFRTADSFNIKKIYLCGITPKPPHREIHKTALGATESVDWEYKSSIIEVINQLKEQNYSIYAVEQVTHSLSLENISINPSESYALIVGNEVEGVSYEALELAHQCIEIPQEGTKHSLNVSVCAGIILWEFYKKLT